MSTRRTRRGFWPGGLHLTMTALVAIYSQTLSASAQSPTPTERVLILERAAPAFPPALRARIETSMQRSVAERPQLTFESSDMPLEDVAMAAGCNPSEDACRQGIAGTVDAQWLLVREFVVNAAGVAELRLGVHRPEDPDATRRVQSIVTAEGPTAPEQVVPTLLAQLYPTTKRAAPVASAPAPTEQPLATATAVAAVGESDSVPSEARAATAYSSAPSKQQRILRASGWTLAVVGCSLLAAGATLGGIARSDHDDYASASIRSEADVDRARDLLESAQERSRRANGLLIGGGIVTAAGVGAVLFALLGTSDEQEQRVTWSLSPQQRGAAVTLAGTWDGI